METSAERHRRRWLGPAQVWVPHGLRVVLSREVVESGTAAGVEPFDDVDLDLEMAAFEVRPARSSPAPPDRLDAGELWVAVVGTLTRPADGAEGSPLLEVGGLCVPVAGLVTALDVPDSERVEAVGLLRARYAGVSVGDPLVTEPWRVEGVEEVEMTSVDEMGRIDGQVRQLPRVPATGETRQRCLYALRLEEPLLDRA